MKATSVPSNEEKRLAALHRYAILDTPAEEPFDRLTRMATRLFDLEYAAVTLIAEERQWIKSCYGFEMEEVERALSFCTHAIQYSEEVMVVENAAEDARFADSPLVTDGEPCIRFYAGAPLKSAEGHNIGTFCVLSAQPRRLSEEQKALLRDLADMAMDEIELRLSMQGADAVYNDKALLSSVITVQNEIASASLKQEDVMNLVVQRAQELTRADGAAVGLVEDNEVVYQSASGSGKVTYAGLRLGMESSLSGRCVQTEEVIHCSDTEQDASEDAEVCRRVGIRSGILVPLRPHREVVGVLNVFSTEAQDFGAKDMQALKLLADLMAGAIERAHNRKKRRESEQRYRALVEQTAEAICFIDPETERVLEANAAFLKLLGYSAAEVEQLEIRDVMARERQDVAQPLQEVGTDHPVTAEQTWRHQSGQRIDVQVTSSKIQQNGRSVLFLVARDVTKQKQFEAKLVEAKEQAEEMARMKSAFLANMSHEIRTPLTSILGLADVLEEEVSDEKRELVSLIRKGGRRLFDTLNSVLDLARLEAGDVELELERVNVKKVVRDTAGLLEPLACEKGLTFEVRLPRVDLAVCAEERHLGRVLTNLLSNAIKFTNAGRVTVRAYANDDERVYLEVEDTGIGISDAFIAQIFDEFKQESMGLTRSHEGAGLGLTISRQLVELMDGRITVESEQGQGSTFSLSFPRFAPAEQEGANKRKEYVPPLRATA